MNYTKTIVCLANSRKTSGRCIAGKELTDSGWQGWVRPVSKRATEEISELDRRYENGTLPQLLDMIDIPFLEPRPHNFQTENHLIDDAYYWEKTGALAWDDLEQLVDPVHGPLWINHNSSYNGLNDRIPEGNAADFASSLYLIQPDELTIIVETEGAEFNDAKRKVRALFRHNGNQYKLAVTDPRIERTYLAKDNGRYPLRADHLYMCISLGEAWNGYCYKLVASIIGKS